MVAGGRHRWKNSVFSLLVFSSSLIISALTGELILRFLGYQGAPQTSISNIYPVDDPVVDWRYIPNSEFTIGRVAYRFNRAGFRDVGHTAERLPQIKRIVVVGDSVTEGYGVEWESVFTGILQTALAGQAETINLAAGGLNTPQEVHLLEREGLRYKPDLVVLNFILNDADFYSGFRGAQQYNAEKESRIGLLNVAIDPRIKRLLKSSALIYLAKERIENVKGRLMGKAHTDYYAKLWASDENRRKVTSGFDGLAALHRQNSFDVVVIIWPLITDYRHYKFSSIHQWVKGEVEKRGFSTIDLLPTFSALSYRELQVTAEDNVHPNALGHKLAAMTFLDWYHSRYAGH